MTAVNPQALTIRQALKSEMEALSQLWLEALQNKPEAFASDYESYRNHSLADWEEWFDQRSYGSIGTIFLAWFGRQLAGMTGITRGHSANTYHGAMIWGVYVRPGYRRQGIAGQLIKACSQWAQERGSHRPNLSERGVRADREGKERRRERSQDRRIGRQTGAVPRPAPDRPYRRHAARPAQAALGRRGAVVRRALGAPRRRLWHRDRGRRHLQADLSQDARRQWHRRRREPGDLLCGKHGWHRVGPPQPGLIRGRGHDGQQRRLRRVGSHLPQL